MTEEKIKVPEAWAVTSAKEAERRELIGEWRQHLAGRQRKALEEEGPHAGFKSGLSVDVLKNLTPDEREELTAHEQMEYNRLKPLEEARRTQRTAYIRAGGDGESFDESWEFGGREMTLHELASGGQIEPSPGQYNSPY